VSMLAALQAVCLLAWPGPAGGQPPTPTAVSRSWFPATQPALPAYLGALDELDNTALQPGALIESDPLSRGAQRVKDTLSRYGLDYVFQQLFEYSIQPLTGLGLNLQWQPRPSLYGLFGVGPNNTPVGGSPSSRVSGGDMSYLFEAGWVPADLWGLGAGAYRLQPFVASVGGVTQGGIGLNVDQQLGARTPFGAFGRFGVGGSTVTNVAGARAQLSLGLIIEQPLHNIGLLREANTNRFGLGVVWSKPSANLQGAAHDDEIGLEVLYTLQVTPTIFVKPDLQAIFNAANAQTSKTSVVFQLPIVAVW